MLKFLYLLAFTIMGVSCENLRPIIGILSQAPSSSMTEGETKNYTSYVAASYVKFMESAGARVVPILTYQDEDYYTNIVDSVNGIIFPGGANSITNTSGYGMAGQILYDKILAKNEAGVIFPLWATCLGFEMLGYLTSQYTRFLVDCDALDLALPLLPYDGYETSKLFENMPQEIFDIFVSQPVTSHFHRYCYTIDDFLSHGFSEDYNILATDLDRDGLEFVSVVEHKTLPIFGTQFHPEKNAYEWKNDESHDSIPHSYDAIRSTQYFADFFVRIARMNDQQFANEEEEESQLIYQYSPKYVGDTGSSFVQVYLFE